MKPNLTPRERSLLRALEFAEAWMAQTIQHHEAEDESTLLPRGYPAALNKVRAAIRKARAAPPPEPKRRNDVHALAGLGQTFCGRDGKTLRWSGDWGAVTCPTCQRVARG